MLLISLTVFLISPVYGATVISETIKSEPMERESTICGPLKERFVFWMWSRMAPNPDPSRVAENVRIRAVHFTTADNKNLSGYKYSAHDESGKLVTPKGLSLIHI